MDILKKYQWMWAGSPCRGGGRRRRWDAQRMMDEVSAAEDGGLNDTYPHQYLHSDWYHSPSCDEKSQRIEMARTTTPKAKLHDILLTFEKPRASMTGTGTAPCSFQRIRVWSQIPCSTKFLPNGKKQELSPWFQEEKIHNVARLPLVPSINSRYVE